MNKNNLDRRSDDGRIAHIEEWVAEERIMWHGEGMEPGLKDIILRMDRTLHGTKDEDGLVARVVTLEGKESVRNRNLGIFAGLGVVAGTVLWAGLKKIMGWD